MFVGLRPSALTATSGKASEGAKGIFAIFPAFFKVSTLKSNPRSNLKVEVEGSRTYFKEATTLEGFVPENYEKPPDCWQNLFPVLRLGKIY